MCMCVPVFECVLMIAVPIEAKEGAGPRELELETVVSYLMGMLGTNSGPL